MSPERYAEIREVAQKLRRADEEGEVAPHLYADARYAILDLLDRLKEQKPLGQNPYLSGDDWEKPGDD